MKCARRTPHRGARIEMFSLSRKEVMIMMKQLGLELLTNLLTVVLKYLPDLLKVPVKK